MFSNYCARHKLRINDRESKQNNGTAEGHSRARARTEERGSE